MPFGLIQIEQERSDLWKAEVEAGFPICKRKMVHAATFEDVLAKVAETYREMVPLPAPKAAIVEVTRDFVVTGHREPLIETRTLHWPAGGDPPEWPAPGTATEPADEQDAPEASEAGEIGTGDQAAYVGDGPEELGIDMIVTEDGRYFDIDANGLPIDMAEPTDDIQPAIDRVREAAGLLPSEADAIARSEMGAAKQRADALAGSAEAGQVAMSDYIAHQDDKIVASLSAAPAETAVRQKRQYRKRQTV